jgi:outer membrane protein OmpA-like peptidoglycan-associated protein
MRAALLLVVLSCGSDHKTAQTPSSVTTASSAPTANAPSTTTREPVGTSLTVTDEIFRICHLDATSEVDAAPKFAFDESLITKADAVVLDKLAVCLTTGPLANKHLQLTGRTDPRGTEEYNMSLGARRAHAVAAYLEQQKVQGTDLNQTSRGSIDATGTDEATWAKDRRVDVAVMH